MKRLSRNKFLYFPLLICIAILTLGNVFHESTYKALLSIPIKPIQKYSAEILIDNGAFIKPEVKFSFQYNRNSFNNEEQEDYYYDDKLLQKIESIVVKGSKCSLTCMKLAREIQEFSSEWNTERWSEYLQSSEQAKQIYVLEVLSGSKSILFFNRIMQLAQSENPEVSNRALNLIKTWGINSLYDAPRTDPF